MLTQNELTFFQKYILKSGEQLDFPLNDSALDEVRKVKVFDLYVQETRVFPYFGE